MKFKVMTTISVLVLAAGFLALTLSLYPGAASVSASDARNGVLQVTKECSKYTGAAGDYCTITSSNLDAIAVGSKVFYDQAANTPAGLLDSDIVLDAGTGNRAVGHCTLDLGNYLGLCTFSDGTGQLTGFSARVVVSPTGGPNFNWDGTYRFSPQPPR
ncbi:MAG: hypothetical protein LAN59_01135 [Acidobacteriia bacterium]|nr:hypothetical protein [Terriglobia bacterium]